MNNIKITTEILKWQITLPECIFCDLNRSILNFKFKTLSIKTLQTMT
jgi:hypothetical protein